jgi:SAM-dependent methyltransferase
VKREEAYTFERNSPLHETRKTKGFLNRITSIRARVYHDDRVNRKSINILGPLVNDFETPVIVAIGAGGGGLLRLMWHETRVLRVGIDINHTVLATEGRVHFEPIEGNAYSLPIRDRSADIVLFDYVLHHLMGQGMIESALNEGGRVLRNGGYLIAREPSSWSPSGVALNLANKFRLMNFISGASNYEFAISPGSLLHLLRRQGSQVAVHGLSYLWSRRLPIWLQNTIVASEPYLFSGRRRSMLADYLVYVVRKDCHTTESSTGTNDTR